MRRSVENAVKMINNLSAELDVMRLSMIETGLETISYNLNRKNSDLRFFDFGKTYFSQGVGSYLKQEHLALYLTGYSNEGSWRSKKEEVDFFNMKGLVSSILQLCGVKNVIFKLEKHNSFELALRIFNDDQLLGIAGKLCGR